MKTSTKAKKFPKVTLAHTDDYPHNCGACIFDRRPISIQALSEEHVLAVVALRAQSKK